MKRIAGVTRRPRIKTYPNGGMETIPIGRFDLLPADVMIRIAKLFRDKAKKYLKNNWRLVPQRAHFNHAMGHAFAYAAGDTSDDHLAHMCSRIMMAMAVEDDRPWDTPEVKDE